MFKELVMKNRSYRRFDASEKVSEEQLRYLVGLACKVPSGGNQQPLKYIISVEPGRNQQICDCLAWASALKDWNGPKRDERPTGYIIILNDKEIMRQSGCDHGIAAQTIMLGAVEMGLGGCMMGAVNRERLREDLNIPEQYDVLLVLAIGKPAETVLIEPMPENGDVKYWRDEVGHHHVPKRDVDDVIVS